MWISHPDPDLVRERDFAYAIDGVHRYAYRFGGRIDGGFSSELKRQDLDDPDLKWTLVSVSSGPPARWHSRMFHDIRRNRLLLLGGFDANKTGYADVWAFDLASNTWSQLTPGAGGPSAIHNGFPLTYDTRHDQLLYLDNEATAGHAKVWKLDLVSLEWSSVEPETNFNLSANPFASYRVCSAAAYDSLGDRVFLHLANSILYQLDMSDPGAFVAIPGTASHDPCPRLAVDEVGHRLIMDIVDANYVRVVQSRTLANIFNFTFWSADYAPDVSRIMDWAIDPIAGTIEVPFQTDRDLHATLDLKVPRWSVRSKPGRVRASDGIAGAIDPVNRAIYVYGGSIQVYKNSQDDSTVTDSALFRLDADDPAQQEWLHPAGQGPGPLQGAVAVFDSVGRRIVFMGGADASGVVRNEVWSLELDPQPHWSPLLTQSAGPARRGAGAAIDPVSRTAYLIAGTAPAGDPSPGFLWSLDLSQNPAQWNLVMAENPLSTEATSHIGYDRDNHRLIGVDGYFRFTIDLVPAAPPIVTKFVTGSRLHNMGAFDPKRNVMFMHGGWFAHMTTITVYQTAVWSGTEFRDDIAGNAASTPHTKGFAIIDPGLDRFVIVNGDQIDHFYAPFNDFDDRVGVFGVWTLQLDDAVPALIDLADVALEPRGVRVRFSGAGAEGAVRVERAIDGTLDWTWIGDARELSPGLYEWLDETVVPGARYRYRARYTSDGGERVTAVSEAVLVPGAVEFALRAPGGAVGGGWPVVLEGQARPGVSARIELIDVAGRVVSRRSVTGAFRASLAPLSPSAGIYFARLVQGERSVTIKLVRF